MDTSANWRRVLSWHLARLASFAPRVVRAGLQQGWRWSDDCRHNTLGVRCRRLFHTWLACCAQGRPPARASGCPYSLQEPSMALERTVFLGRGSHNPPNSATRKIDSELWCPPSQNCGVLPDPPTKPQVRGGGQDPTHPTEPTNGQLSLTMLLAVSPLNRPPCRFFHVLALVVTRSARWGHMNRMDPSSSLARGVHRNVARSAYHSAKNSPVRASGGTHHLSGNHDGRKEARSR